MATYPSPTLQNLTVNGTATLTDVSSAAATITGGTIDGTAIGATTPSSVKATTLNTSGAATLNSVSSADVTLTGGTIDNVVIGGITPAAATVTNITATGTASGSAFAPFATSATLASTASGEGASLVGYQAIGTGGLASTVDAKLLQLPTVLDYGADPTGVTSSVAAFNAALTANDSVGVPPGTYLLDDAVNVGLQKSLIGYDRRSCILHMPSTFNASALGALVFNGGEPGPTVSNLTILQDQPDSVTPTVYPPCIYAHNCPRFEVSHLRLPAVYIGIDMTGNSGGAILDDIELSPLSIGIDIDGSMDLVKITRLHIWPFGNALNTELTVNQRVAYTAAIGVNSGRCDGLLISDSLLFSMIKALYTYQSSSGTTFGDVVNCDFDDRGGIWSVPTTQSSRLVISNSVFTIGKTDAWFLNQSGGVVLFSNCRFEMDAINTSANAAIQQTGGSLLVTGSSLWQGSNDAQMLYSANAEVVITGTHCLRTNNTSYTSAFLRIINSAGSVNGNFAVNLGTGSSKILMIDTDNNDLVVSGNDFQNWTINYPGTSALAKTRIQGNIAVNGNLDEFSGYVSYDGTTTVDLPSGWTITKLGTGNYSLGMGSLTTDSATRMQPTVTCDNHTNGAIAQWDTAGSTANTIRVRTYVGTTPTDCGFTFNTRRYRSS